MVGLSQPFRRAVGVLGNLAVVGPYEAHCAPLAGNLPGDVPTRAGATPRDGDRL